MLFIYRLFLRLYFKNFILQRVKTNVEIRVPNAVFLLPFLFHVQYYLKLLCLELNLKHNTFVV